MNDLNAFHQLVGETLMFCQCIERDIKFIYAGMLEGDFEKNYSTVERKTLGAVLKDLEVLDNSDNKPYFSFNDYRLLNEIKDTRNYWVHKAYTEFLYQHGSDYLRVFRKVDNKLMDTHSRFKVLSDETEKIRIHVLEKYNRI